MSTYTKTPHIVIVGSGFAGIEAVRTLKGVRAKITLITKSPTFEYYPALYKLVTGALPIEVSVPVSTILGSQHVELVIGTCTSFDKARQVVTVEREGKSEEIAYDYLVLGLGSETNYFNIKGLPELSHSFKSVKAALALKRHFCEQFSKAKHLPKEQAVAMLHVLIVGGGPSGVELAGDLRSYLSRVAGEFDMDPSLVTIDLIESNPRVLPTLSPKVSKRAEARLRKMGVNIFVNRTLAEQEVEEVILKDMSVNAQTVIWTAGTRINSTYTTLPGIVLSDRKRVVVTETLSLPDDPHVFIVGDGAATEYSGLAQTAIKHGAYVGGAIRRLINGKKLRPYVPTKPAFVIPIGTGWALFSMGNFLMTGFIPWLLRSAVDFRYFLHIVPLGHVFAVFKKGYKYRGVKGGCSLE